MLESFRIFFVQAATSWLVGPAGLSKFIIPNRIVSLADLSSGLLPYFGSVRSGFFTIVSRFVSHGGFVLGIFFCIPVV